MAAAVAADNARKEREAKAEEERERQRKAIAEEQRQLRAQLAEERNRVQKLRDQARRWRESDNLRRLVAEGQRRGIVPDLDCSSTLAEWTQWGLRQADRLDPFTPSPSSILDDERRALRAQGRARWAAVLRADGWQWRDREIVGVSETYTSTTAREQGVAAVEANAGVAGVD